MLDRLRPGTEVTAVRPAAGPGRPGAAGWVVESRQAGEQVRRDTFDYVAVASGAHHHVQVPNLPGRELFGGTVLHSNDVRAGTFTGRRVVVVGGGKSALDLVTRAAREAASATLVQRKVNWMVPQRLLLGLVGYKWILLTRFGEALLPRYHDPACVRPIDRINERVKRVLWRVIARDMLISAGLHRLPKRLRPAHPLPFHLAHAGVMPRGYTRAVRRGRIAATVSAVEEYTGDGLRLATGAEVFPFLDSSVPVHGFDRATAALPGHRAAGRRTAGVRRFPPSLQMRDAVDARHARRGRRRCCRVRAATISGPTTSTARTS